MIPRTNHNTHRTTFVISSQTGCCRATKSTRITTKTSNRPIYHRPERTCLCSIYHAIYSRDITDQNEHVCSVYSMQFTVVIPRTMFVQYIACNHKMHNGTTVRSAAFSFNSPSRQLQHVAQGGREAADNDSDQINPDDLTNPMPLSIGRQSTLSVPPSLQTAGLVRRLQEDHSWSSCKRRTCAPFARRPEPY